MQTTNEKPHLSETLGGELKQGWDSTDRLLERLKSFSILKLRTKEFIDWALESGHVTFDKANKKTFRSLQSCGQYLIFRNYLISKRSRLLGACSCKQHLMCAFCASRRGVRNAMAYKEKVDYVQANSPGTIKMLFITFTVKNGESLNERFNHLRSSMQTILKHRNNQKLGKGKHHTEMSKLIGGVFSYEFKRGSGEDLWHPHIHMIALIPDSYIIDAAALKQEWLNITGDSSVINIQYSQNDAPYLEVFAYALKFSEMSHPDRWFASQQLKRERLISSFGELRGVNLDDDVNDDVLTEDEPYVDTLFKWLGLRYSKVEILQSSDFPAAA